MRPPASPLSTTTTRRTSCTLATRIPPNYEPGSRFRVLAPDGSEVSVTVPAGAEAGDMIQVPLTVTDHGRRASRFTSSGGSSGSYSFCPSSCSRCSCASRSAGSMGFARNAVRAPASTASRTPAARVGVGAAPPLKWRATSTSRSRRASCATTAARRRGSNQTGTSLGHHAARTDSAGSAVAAATCAEYACNGVEPMSLLIAPPANATTRFVNWRAAAASRR